MARRQSGDEPGPALRRAWDARAWADARPDKVIPDRRRRAARRWLAELADLGYRDPTSRSPSARSRSARSTATRPSGRCWRGSRRVGRRGTPPTSAARSNSCIARRNLVIDAAVRLELAEDLTARALARLRAAAGPRRACPSTSARSPHRMCWTSRPTSSAGSPHRAQPRRPPPSSALAVTRVEDERLDAAQRGAVAALAGDRAVGRGRGRGRRREDHHPGRGTRRALEAAGSAADGGHADAEGGAGRRRPARRRRVLGRLAGPPARLALGRHRHLDPPDRATDPTTGGRYRRSGRRGAAAPRGSAGGGRGRDARPGHRPRPAHDRRRAPARGSRWWGTGTSSPPSGAAVCSTSPPAGSTPTRTSPWTRCTASPARRHAQTATRHRPDDEYADLSLAMRTGDDPGAVFDALLARGQIQVHASDADRHAALADSRADAAHAATRGQRSWPTPASRSPRSTPRSATGSSPPAASTTTTRHHAAGRADRCR